MGKKQPSNSMLFSASSKDPEPFSTSSPSPGPWPSFRCANSSMEPCFSTFLEMEEEEEAVMRGLSSDRLFFDPDTCGRSSTLVEAEAPAFKGGVAVAVESTDPLRDFRASMEEMMEARGVRDWVWLQEMLGWFLMANEKETHEFIFDAFSDLITSLLLPSSLSFSSGSHHCDPLCSSSSRSLSSSCSCGSEEMGYGPRGEF